MSGWVTGDYCVVVPTDCGDKAVKLVNVTPSVDESYALSIVRGDEQVAYYPPNYWHRCFLLEAVTKE